MTEEISLELSAIAGEVAALPPGLSDRETRALKNLVLACLLSMKRGSTRLPLAELQETLASFVEEEEAQELTPAIIELIDRVPSVIGRPGAYVPLIADGPNIYLQRLHHGEARFAETLLKRLRSPGFSVRAEDLEAALADVVSRPAGVELSDEQRAAVLRSAGATLSVISGGPGTGKTSIVVAIARVLARLGLPPESFALAAPTGKAANRIAESIERSLRKIEDPSEHDLALLAKKPEASTLHRLLGYVPARDRFQHHENNPLSQRAVIVDESSMIDLFLMDRLARSVRTDARLVLLGDAEQLPSVDAGTVLRDITTASLSVTLKKSFRMREDDPAGRNILSVARAIRDGKVEAITPRRDVKHLVFRGVEMVSSAARTAFLKRWFLERFADHPLYLDLSNRIYSVDETGGFSPEDEAELRRLFQHLESFKILCVTKSEAQPTGAEAINRALHAMMIQDRAIAGDRGERFLPGEPILVVRNDYERKLFNGDQGVVLRGKDDSRIAVFESEGRFRAFHLEPLGELIAPAHAITVHKAQGSEYEVVALLLPERDVPLLTREVLYTALTRSKRSTVIVGERDMLERGADRRIRRFSGLPDRLAQGLSST